MKVNDLVRLLQTALRARGETLTVDGEFGPKTEAASNKFAITIVAEPLPAPLGQPENPAYKEAKKYDGKSEHDSKWSGWLSKFWGKVGLPNYKTIVGTSFAWCALFVAAMGTQTGQKIVTSGGAAARNWGSNGSYGQVIDWKKDGIPKGAVIHVNHNANCNSSDGNHVGFSDGDCTVADLTRPGATLPIFGGNQADMVKRSNFKVSTVCSVRWPSEIPKPGAVTKSWSCLKVEQAPESTR